MDISDILNVLNVLNVLKVLNVLDILKNPKDKPLACRALSEIAGVFAISGR